MTRENHEPLTNLNLLQNKEVLSVYSEDFGRINHSKIDAYLQPKTNHELQSIFTQANLNHWKLAIRNQGLSQSGIALAVDGGMVLDMSSWNQVENVNLQQNTIQTQAAASWRQIISKTIAHGLMPFVVPYNLDLSLGGTLAVGGIGGNSFRYGASVNHVSQIEALSGNGDHLQLNPTANEESFFAAFLANPGRCGVILNATLPLRHCKPYVKTFYLIYDDMQHWLDDQIWLSQTAECDHIEANCTPCMQGFCFDGSVRVPLQQWFFSLQISIEYDQDSSLHKAILNKLHFLKLLYIENTSMAEFVARIDSRLQMMKQMGADKLAHPWFECFLTRHQLQQILPDILQRLPLSIGGGHRIIPIKKQANAPFFMLPEGEDIFIFTLLPLGIAPTQLSEVKQFVNELHLQTCQLGGKRYLSGWIPNPSTGYWQQHYGDQFNAWLSMKEVLDPRQILSSFLFP